MIIETSGKAHQKLFDTQMLLEETGQRQQATAMRLNRELNNNAQRFDATIKQVDKMQTRNLNELREQLDTNIIMVEKQLDQAVVNIKEGMQDQSDRLDKMADDAAIRKWVLE